jgi:uncharacterized protein (DUF1499 family)
VKKFLLILPLLGILSFGCSGKKPGNIGLQNGNLAPCPSSPNCVSSQEGQKPFDFSGSAEQAMTRLGKVIEAMPGARVETLDADYLHATFKSRVFGFVDDVEFHADREKGLIHFRSASRLGYWDLGANKRRIKKIKKLFEGS